MADEVEVVGRCRNTPIVRFVGKSGRYLNAVGERVTEAQVSAAVSTMNVRFSGFTAAIKMSETPHYVLVFEGEGEPSVVADGFDRALAEQNVEYDGKRRSGRLSVPTAMRMEPGSYARLHMVRVKEGAPASQLKDPVIAIDQHEWERIVRAGTAT
jgi:hypothetical protein